MIQDEKKDYEVVKCKIVFWKTEDVVTASINEELVNQDKTEFNISWVN